MRIFEDECACVLTPSRLAISLPINTPIGVCYCVEFNNLSVSLFVTQGICLYTRYSLFLTYSHYLKGVRQHTRTVQCLSQKNQFFLFVKKDSIRDTKLI